MDLLERINRHLRQLAPHQKERAGMIMLVEARDEIEKLRCGIILALSAHNTGGLIGSELKVLRSMAPNAELSGAAKRPLE